MSVGSLFKELFTPRGVTVETEYPIRVRVDIVLTNERGERREEQNKLMGQASLDNHGNSMKIKH